MTERLFQQYRTGIRRLIALAGKDNPRIAEALVLQHRLLQNLRETQAGNPTPALETSRARTLESCNRLSHGLLGKSFYELCGLPASARKGTGILSLSSQPRLTIDVYFDSMNELLQAEEIQLATISPEARALVRQKTLALFAAVDGVQKGHIVQFLYEAGLITEGAGVLFLSGADLVDIHLEGASLIEAHLAGADLRAAHLDAAHLEWARLGEAYLQRASLRRAFLVACQLSHADLHAACLEEAKMLGANFSGANLSEAHLENTQMQWACFLTANLQGAFLVNAHLVGADFQSANLAQADLSGANLEEARFSFARLRGAKYDRHTRWPQGFDPISAGAINQHA